ncbi:ATP-binding protein [Streptomyces davaonensis]|uniref:ATP-binding protein n=1 Tax=Streptomyces davaonensis TaxID=348043 RepID=UPI001E52B252|nr:LuxR family transcriptional regulator [Streptomyces davaonensis]
MSRSGLRGRELELGELAALIDSVARTGSAGVALVVGEPGIGKSTLLGEAVDLAAASGFSVGVGKAEELDRLVPLSSLLACVLDGDRPSSSFVDVLVDLARHHDQRIWLVERLAEIIETRAGGGPVLIGLDDLQWADPLSRFALQQLPARLRTSPVLWVLAGRCEPESVAAVEEIVGGAGPGLSTVTLTLGPLSPAAIAHIAADALGDSPDDGVRGLLDAAGGNPFLAVEVLSGLRTPTGEDGPPGLLISGRLRALRPGTLRFLQMGAVLGRGFGFSDAVALCGQSAASLVGELEEAVREGILDDDGERLVFRHDLLRQAVYGDIPPSARKVLHREAARVLLAAGRRPIDAVPHILLGALPGDEEAVALLRRAADDVLSVTPGLAADLMTRALELVPAGRPLRFDVGEQAILCLTRAGRHREALATGDELLGAQPSLDVLSRIQAALGGSLWSLDLARELRLRTEAALATHGAAPEIAARLAALRTLALSREHDLVAAREAGEAALLAATGIGDREAHVLALSGLGEIAQNAGESTVALERFAALSTIDSAFLPEKIVAHLHLDDFASGRRLLQRAMDGRATRQAMLLWAQGQHDLGLGRLDDADADFETMERLEDEVQASVQQLNGRVLRSLIALLRGDRDAAREHLDAARERLTAKPNPGNTAAVRFLEAVHAEADGDIDLAVDRIRHVQRQGAFMRWRLLRGAVASAVGMSLRGGRHDLAEDLAAQAAAHAERNPGVPTANGVAAQALGLVRNDLALLERSVELLGAGPRPLVRAAAQADLGRALLAAGRKRQGVAALTYARDAYAESGAHGAAARVQRGLEGTGVRRATAVQRRPVQGWDALTAAEMKIARLIAQGHTNRSAADLLVLSPHTVNTHLTSVFRKLAINSRVQLANLVTGLEER